MADIKLGSDPLQSIQSMFNSALHFNADASFETPRTSNTVTTDAVAGGAPIDNTAGGGWGDFWRGTLGALVGYGITKDAVQSGVKAGAVAAPAPAPAAAAVAAMPTQKLLVLAVAGLAAVYLVVRAAKG